MLQAVRAFRAAFFFYYRTRFLMISIGKKTTCIKQNLRENYVVLRR